MSDSGFGIGIYDRDGNPIATLEEWWKLKTDRRYSIIEQTPIGSYLVSTVWLGFDHGFGDLPVIFETMVFTDHSEDEFGIGGDCYRYHTIEEARAGHDRIVNEVSLLVAAAS